MAFTNPPESLEVPLSQAFALLATEEYADVSLKGTDGVLVPANRTALTVRSEYFKTMFKKGAFKEATNDLVPIGFSGNVLKAIVEYIHTDKSTMLVEYSEIVIEDSSKLSAGDMGQFQTLVSLTEAAIYVGLPGLCKQAQNCLGIFMNVMPSAAFPLLVASKQEGPVISQELEGQAWKIYNNATNIVQNEGLLGNTSGSVVSAILQDAKGKVNNAGMFNLIHSWSKSEPSVPGEPKESRNDTAKALIQDFVELEFIDPEELSSLVETSGLVTKDQLFDTYKKLAMKAKPIISSHQSHSSQVGSIEWKRTKSKTLTAVSDWKSDSLNGVVFQLGGTYRWAITTGPVRDIGVWIGVVKSTDCLDPNRFCGNQQHCWGVYGRHGSVYSCGQEVCGPSAADIKFGAGSTVTMTLDLSGDSTNNGTLSISVNDQQAVPVFSNLKARLAWIMDGFVPAVSCWKASATIGDVQRL
ncbi:expressed unknown protein [Seminavis robusta]|uniref:BTB domain-containing protein n=1 Tax=Seminavis robusta TaxID=568900 RepID=A0A9N8HX13_9STRA|nr:expressed unknown protein [Seminavis robusta]|eukprot:Sro2360_g324732.1  (468) ;mRNA; f:4875-6278